MDRLCSAGSSTISIRNSSTTIELTKYTCSYQSETFAAVLEAQLTLPAIGSIYKHYKDNLYEVVGLARHTESEEHMVVYKGLYGSFDTWVRPLKMFCEEVVLSTGESVKRFSCVSRPAGCDSPSSSTCLFEESDMLVLQANIDDMTAEVAGYFIEKMLSVGAKDAWIEHAGMKKNRPAVQINVLCKPEDKSIILTHIFQESTTIGVRILPIKRVALPRRIVSVSTKFGDIRVKISDIAGKITTAKPEFDDVKALAVKLGVPLRQILDEATVRAKEIVERMSGEANPDL